ncbi:MAG: hypothetical protein ACOC33_03935 [bacterium]
MEKIEIVLSPLNLSFDINSKTFSDNYSNVDVIRYFKGMFRNKERFIDEVINKLRYPYEVGRNEIDEETALMFKLPEELYDEFIAIFEDVKPFSYKEAFEINDEEFRIKVFDSIDIVDMIESLGHTRISTDGKQVNHKQYDKDGNFIGNKTYDVIYEVHEINCEALGLDENSHAIKCWCTSTNKEHWLWIDSKYKDKPLEAIASTFYVHKNIIPFIKEIKRQGDVLIVEKTKDIKPEGEEVALTADQYFGFLTAQS